MKPGVAASLIGAFDNAQFLAKRPEMLQEKPQRFAQTVSLIGLWLFTAKLAAQPRTSGAAVAAGGVLTTMNAVLLAAHLKAKIATPRIFAGAILSAVTLADIVRRRS